jgi:hypothetical protein
VVFGLFCIHDARTGQRTSTIRSVGRHCNMLPVPSQRVRTTTTNLKKLEGKETSPNTSSQESTPKPQLDHQPTPYCIPQTLPDSKSFSAKALTTADQTWKSGLNFRHTMFAIDMLMRETWWKLAVKEGVQLKGGQGPTCSYDKKDDGDWFKDVLPPDEAKRTREAESWDSRCRAC